MMFRTVLLALALATGMWAADEVDAGNHYDPNGATVDAGSHYDPDGLATDAGGHVDPNG